jgi:hypothetical protein
MNAAPAADFPPVGQASKDMVREHARPAKGISMITRMEIEIT